MASQQAVLIVDNCLEDRLNYGQYLLADPQQSYIVVEEATGKAALAVSQDLQVDCILLEYLLPDMNGLEFIAQLKQQAVMPAVIMLTRHGNEFVAVQALKSGIQDYLVKEQTTPELLRSTIQSAITNARLRQQLQLSGERFRTSVENMLDCFGVYSAIRDNAGQIIDFRVEYVNAAGRESTQMIKEEHLSKKLCAIVPDNQESEFFDAYCRVVETGEPLVQEVLSYTDVFGKQQLTRAFDLRATKLEDGFVLVWRDVTEKKQSDRKLAETDRKESEARLRLALETTKTVCWERDLSSDQLLLTGTFSESATPQAIPYREALTSLVHPDDQQKLHRAHESAIASLGSFAVEHRLMEPQDHKWRWVLARGTVIVDAATRHMRMVGVSVDISERKRAEAALRESEAKFRRIVDSNIVGIYFGDFSGRVAEANDAFLETVGYTREDLEVGIIHWDRMTPPEYQELDRQKIQQIREFGVCTPFEKEYLHKDGTRIPILLGIAQIEGREEEGYSACFVLDLTRNKQAEAERTRLLELEKAARAVSEAAQSAAEAANRAKDEFVAMVSHDLRSPLNAILGWTQLLRTRKVDETITARALETIERNAKSQAKLLEDLLNISRILQGKLKLEVCQVNLVTIVEEVMATAHPAADAKNIHLVSVVSGSIPPIAGDPDRLQQVLGNLLSNAIKFTPEGGQVEVQLLVGMGQGNNSQLPMPYVQITVSDTGIGISPDFLPYVFERYRQADEANRQGGLGLGLAIALHLIELHAGTLRVDSPGEGQGATFTINLPYS